MDAAAATEWVRESVRQAWADPTASEAYVLEHAQEMEPAVVSQHIDLYVNEFTENLGDEGYAAIRSLAGSGGRAWAWYRRSRRRRLSSTHAG